jgi:hypothetical protein
VTSRRRRKARVADLVILQAGELILCTMDLIYKEYRHEVLNVGLAKEVCSRATAAHVKIPAASLARRKMKGKKFMISGDLECPSAPSITVTPNYTRSGN